MDQVFPPLLAIIGPTASGKTRLACQLAYNFHAGIISVDSRQVYRRLTLGTGKDLEEYVVNDQAIPYYLIDHVEPGERYDVARFQHEVYDVLSDFQHPLAILCGGTGLYFQSILQGFDRFQFPVLPELRKSLDGQSYEDLLYAWEHLPPLDMTFDISTKKRLIRAFEIRQSYEQGVLPQMQPLVTPLIFGLNPSREVRRSRISQRLKNRLHAGLLEEVVGLLEQGVSAHWLEQLGLEYAWAIRKWRGDISDEEFRRGLEVAIHQMAKRQMTFFRSMEKKGVVIHWLDGDLDEDTLLSEIKKKIPQHVFS